MLTANGELTWIEAFKGYFNSYLVGFSDAEFRIIVAFGQGYQMFKYWSFKGARDRELFGIPPINN